MSTLLQEAKITLAQAGREIPSIRGGHTQPKTISAWHRRGVKIGDQVIKLEVFWYGGRIATTREAVQRFLSRCADQAVDVGETASRPGSATGS
jgi:hypothetical protein